METQEKPYTIVYERGIGTVAKRIDTIIPGEIRLTRKSFDSAYAAQLWTGMQGQTPWIISEDGSAITIFSRGTARILHETPDGEQHEIKMPLDTFMSMIDSAIHLFEDYHYNPNEECWTKDGKWIQPWKEDV